MADKHFTGQTGRFKRLLGIVMSMLLLCSIFMPAYAMALGDEPDAALDGASAAQITYSFYVGEELYARRQIGDGEMLEKPDDPEMDGKSFVGWFTAEDETGNEFTAFGPVSVTEDAAVSLYARWITDEPAEGQESDSITDEVPEAEKLDMVPSLMKGAPSTLADSTEDPNYIVVEKKFIGLPADQIPGAFQITVSSHEGGTYTLNSDNTASQITDTEENVIWRWKITGVGTGTYTVSETNETVQNYNVMKAGEGTVEVKAADITISTPVHETTCSHTNWPVKVDGDSNVLFAATLTQGGVAVISKTPLSASQRAAVSAAVLKINGPWKTPVYFYSIEEQMQSGTGFELNGATITYNEASEEVIIGQTKYWQHVATLTYSISEASNPEIAITNTYTRAVADVTVTKTVAGSMGDYDKSFNFTVTVKTDDTDAAFKIGETKHTGTASFVLKHNGSITLKEIPISATVTVTETNYSENGYSTSYTIDGANAATGNIATLQSVGEEGHSICFTNKKDVVPDTGILLDSLPYILSLGVVIAGTAVVIVRRRRKRNDD